MKVGQLLPPSSVPFKLAAIGPILKRCSRVGDTYPTQHLDVQLKVYLYRWKPKRAVDCGKPDVRRFLDCKSPTVSERLS